MIKQKDTLIISISLFITIAAWVGFNIYHASVTSTISETLQKQIEPIEGKFDTELIESLKKREKVLPISQTRETATKSAEETTVPEEPLLQEPENSQVEKSPTPVPTVPLPGGQQVISAPGGE